MDIVEITLAYGRKTKLQKDARTISIVLASLTCVSIHFTMCN